MYVESKTIYKAILSSSFKPVRVNQACLTQIVPSVTWGYFQFYAGFVHRIKRYLKRKKKKKKNRNNQGNDTFDTGMENIFKLGTI